MESGMQQATESNEQTTQAPTEGARRLTLVQWLRVLADGDTGANRGAMIIAAETIERLERRIRDLRTANDFMRAEMCRERIVVVDGACVGD